MSELGIGDEMFSEADIQGNMTLDARVEYQNVTEYEKKAGEIEKARVTEEDLQEINALPIVLVKNFSGKAGSEDLLNVLVQWVANLIDRQVSLVGFRVFLRYSPFRADCACCRH